MALAHSTAGEWLSTEIQVRGSCSWIVFVLAGETGMKDERGNGIRLASWSQAEKIAWCTNSITSYLCQGARPRSWT